MAIGDWWDVDTYLVQFWGLDEGFEDLTDQGVAYAYADQMIANMAEGEWKQEWIETAYAITKAVDGSTTGDAEAYWYNLTIVWISYDGWAQSNGIPYWRELGDWFGSQFGFAIEWEELATEAIEDASEALRPKSTWETVRPYAYAAGGIWLGLAVIKAAK